MKKRKVKMLPGQIPCTEAERKALYELLVAAEEDPGEAEEGQYILDFTDPGQDNKPKKKYVK